MTQMIATVQIQFDSDRENAEDYISVVFSEKLEMTEHLITDWQYLKVGDQYMRPTEGRLAE